jgi:hypothetical protein
MELYVLDREINILGVFTSYDAIIWTTKLSEPGTFKASFGYSEKMNTILNVGNLIYKTDEDEPGIITRKYIQLLTDGSQTIQVQGYLSGRYLNQRIIWKKMLMSGTYEEIMRKMVDEQVIHPEIEERRMPRIALGELHGYGDSIEKQITYDNLQEALTELSELSELGWKLKLDLAEKMFFFEVYQGKDRTANTEEPCIFARKFKNVYSQNYTDDISNLRNICLVGGAGEDEDRILKTVGEAAGLDRYEMFYNASGISNSDISETEYLQQLSQKGQEQLRKYYRAEAFESRINENKAMQWNIGDYVTCYDSDWGITVNTQIKEVEKTYSKEEKTVEITFGDSTPSLIQMIRAQK